MTTQLKEVPADQTTEDKSYFLARRIGQGGVWYWSQYKSGKQDWSTKAGIGIHFKGGTALAETVKKNREKVTDLIALEVPEDHNKRWRAKR